MPAPSNRVEDARTYQDYYQIDTNQLWHEYLARVLSGLNNDNTPFTMPISIAADIPDFSNALRQALNQQAAASTQLVSDQANALQNLAAQQAQAAQTATGATQAAAQQVLAAAQAQAASISSQASVFAQIVAQNDEQLIQNERIILLLQSLVGEEITPADAADARLNS